MIGQSRTFLKAVELVDRISGCDVPVLIEGETGTGKEIVAQAIHYGGARRSYPFVPVNCGAIPDALIENELFGHERGAYTDAQSNRRGVIARAQRGTLFFDEVDALSPKAQVTLLRFLQDQSYTPLGAAELCHADVRVIAASNKDLSKLVEQECFRLDLLFRLKVMQLALPPLRERTGDAALLAAHFIRACSAKFGRGEKTLHWETVAWFDKYHWPGNIRELENLICREYLLADGAVIRIPPPAHLAPERRSAADRRRGDLTCTHFNKAKMQAIAKFEQCYLAEAMVKAQGNITKAARLAGKDRRAFGKLLKKHSMDKSTYSV
jgi:DNA-binding NtrC family response regulator